MNMNRKVTNHPVLGSNILWKITSRHVWCGIHLEKIVYYRPLV